MILVGSFGDGMVQDNFGQVKILDVTTAPDSGALTGYLLIPANATTETPVPMVVEVHGNFNNREMQDANYVELSRRDFVVFAINI